MASVQVLEIRPLEYEVEELSADMVGSIWGGLSLLDCSGQYLRDLAAVYQPDGTFDVQGFLDATGKFLQCVDASV